MDSDCDDAGALALLHALADRAECEILAALVSSKNEWSAPCVDAINTFYNRPDLPLGGPRRDGASKPSKYARQIARQFPHDTKPESLPDAMDVYRRVVATQPDNSVTVGYLTNIADLLQLPATADHPAGIDLAKSKVQKWVCMGGNFIGRPARDDVKLSNNNFTFDKRAALHAIHNWPTDLVFVGREIGSVPSGLKAGARLSELPETNPVRLAYALYFDGAPKDRHVADPTTVLYAVRGLRDYWTIESTGHIALNPDMTFEWQPTPDSRQSYLLKKTLNGLPNDRHIERTIEELMLHTPTKKPSANPGPTP
jgi:inosine-uridine nucleoside N-ribohydrolase